MAFTLLGLSATILFAGAVSGAGGGSQDAFKVQPGFNTNYEDREACPEYQHYALFLQYCISTFIQSLG